MQAARDAARALVNAFSAYPDLRVRAARYLRRPRLPATIRDWETGVEGSSWTWRKVLHALALAFDPRPDVPRDHRAFDLGNATQCCMMIRVRRAGISAAQQVGVWTLVPMLHM